MKIKFLKNPNVLIITAIITVIILLAVLINYVKSETSKSSKADKKIEELNMDETLMQSDVRKNILGSVPTYTPSPPKYDPIPDLSSIEEDEAPWEQGSSDNTEPDTSPVDETPWGTGPSM